MAPVKNTSAVKKSKFVIDCSAPANDKIFDVAAFVIVAPRFPQ
jgi:large subunit ribosomal protein L22e